MKKPKRVTLRAKVEVLDNRLTACESWVLRLINWANDEGSEDDEPAFETSKNELKQIKKDPLEVWVA